jgi:hypothetical protein
MKINQVFTGLLGDGEVIAYFGRARLVKRLDCKYELRGGSGEDHSAAKEWISLFMHEVVLVTPNAPRSAQTARPAYYAQGRGNEPRGGAGGPPPAASVD